MVFIGFLLVSSGLSLVAFSRSLALVSLGGLVLLGGIIWLLLYQVLHREGWEELLEKEEKSSVK